MPSRLLVTGGAGFIGSNFVRYWADRHAEPVIVLDALTYAGNLESIQSLIDAGRVTFVHGRIEDEGTVATTMREHRIDTIVHFAAESHVDRSIRGPDAFLTTNVLGTHSLLKVAQREWGGRSASDRAVRFHHVSTDEVYGTLGPRDAAFTEMTPYAPNSPYAATKAASDHLVRAYHHTYGLPVTTTNCSNNYGPFHFPEKFIPLLIVNGLTGRELPVYGDGLQIRDWLHVADHCRAIEAVLERGTIGETYNVGGNAERTNRDVVAAVCRQIDAAFASDPTLAERFPDAPAARGAHTETLIRFVTDRPGHDRRYAIDASRIRDELGVTPSTSFDAGLTSTIAWFVANERWWRRILDGSYRQWVATHYGE